MKKQILILVGVLILAVGFFLLTRNSSSNSGTLFEHETDLLETDGITDEVEDSIIAVEEEDGEMTTLQGKVFVDVQGEVVNPGVFEVNSDVRVGYLIELAGGLTDEANVRGLNQAARIYDEMIIFVPHIDDIFEVAEESSSHTESGANSSESNLISLSTASALELQSLPGIGPAISASIIAHREANGSFSTVDELTNISGIGAGIVENIREFVQP